MVSRRSLNAVEGRTSRPGMVRPSYACEACLSMVVLAVATLAGCTSLPTGSTQEPASVATTALGPAALGPAAPVSGSARTTLAPPQTNTGGDPYPSPVDVVSIEKCWSTATPAHGGQVLVKASSSDPTARLLVYSSDGTLLGEAQNGGGGRYGGSVMAFQRSDPRRCIVRSSAGGSASAPTGPFQLEH